MFPRNAATITQGTTPSRRSAFAEASPRKDGTILNPLRNYLYPLATREARQKLRSPAFEGRSDRRDCRCGAGIHGTIERRRLLADDGSLRQARMTTAFPRDTRPVAQRPSQRVRI